MKNIDINETIDIVFNKLSKLSKKDFYKELELHKDGEVAKILKETGALEVGNIESQTYSDSYFLEENLFNKIDTQFNNNIDYYSKFANNDLSKSWSELLKLPFDEIINPWSEILSSESNDIINSWLQYSTFASKNIIDIVSNISVGFVDSYITNCYTEQSKPIENENLLNQLKTCTSDFYNAKKHKALDNDSLALAA